MDKGMRLFGHPVHVMVVHFPIALWSVAPLCDAVWWWRGDTLWLHMALWSGVLGFAGAVLAAITGLVDYLAIPEGHPAERTASAHMITMLGAMGTVAAGLIVHGFPMTATPMRIVAAMGIMAGGLALMGFGAWLGGELVFRHGLGRTE